MTDFIAIPAITVLCYLFGEIYKTFVPEEGWKHIPVLCGAYGGFLGVLCYLFISRIHTGGKPAGGRCNWRCERLGGNGGKPEH